ncbi:MULTISPECIES: DUF1830 domain-containing protein [Okeania]|uniref:DUF1830 domain-containing protein n=1 Tax=Okeania hirsuta TaxID=1458930 RepID=A0A3N6RU16_9CYAN|nr:MULTISPECIES: DUF1830 domain-containing protein [Okeania]NEP03377.1 DUF1830 domain-containing protein [Okeania sp. SIO4D6]NET15073.1 DUF1830 domain-containing protein [Okeania sp. SIO1H6]NEP70554.1 DUF1830 domain-containing protein [Okeania sp. SIO2G5]NEP90812.1 DUF1830 domain-containing protein [Okeania sp. SIO2C2]NEP96275.1 DUF1830 domain-containing protein [Okeania sp. SIO2F5]
MTIALDRLPKKQVQKILCFYVNTTHKIQIARISNPQNEYWEHTVFPGERFLFEAVPEAELEIHQSIENAEIRCEHFLCKDLKVDE